MKHTKGKWILGASEVTHILDKDARILATVHGLEDGINNKKRIIESRANAKLIAAAPEMYQLLTFISGKKKDLEEPNTLRNVIRKADHILKNLK